MQEIQPAEGCLIDHTKKIFYVETAETSHITWKNTPQMGQIQITKKSADDNPINGLTAGTLLPMWYLKFTAEQAILWIP